MGTKLQFIQTTLQLNLYWSRLVPVVNMFAGGPEYIYGQDIKKVNIVYRDGKEMLLRMPYLVSKNPLPDVPTKGLAESEIQIVTILSLPRSTKLKVLQSDPVDEGAPDDLLEAQQKDPEVLEMLKYLEHGELPVNDKDAHRILMQSSAYCLIDKVLYYVRI